MDKQKDTARTYGFLWQRVRNVTPPDKWHFDYMQEVISESIVRGSRGIEVGSGSGYDTYKMAQNNPSVEIISAELSNGVFKTKDLTSNLKNVTVVKCSVLELPLKENIFDFAYSYGVLHHTENPQKGLSEIVRVLKENCPAFLYLYENHSENTIKRIAIKRITRLRKITVKIPPKILYALCWTSSPFIFILFSFPSKVLKLFRATRGLADKFPFNFGTHPFSLCGDLYDRFRAPIEYRFSKHGLHELLRICGLSDINITRLKGKAGWVAWGYKK